MLHYHKNGKPYNNNFRVYKDVGRDMKKNVYPRVEYVEVEVPDEFHELHVYQQVDFMLSPKIDSDWHRGMGS